MASGSFILTRTAGTQYLQGRIDWWSSSDGDIANSSNVTARLVFKRTNTGYTTYGTGTFNLTIEGQNFTTGSVSYRFTSSDTVMLEATVTVPHSSDGKCTITLSGSYSGNTPIGGNGSQQFNLDPLNRQPALIYLSTNNIGTTSINATCTASVDCDIWQYRLNYGDWVTFGTNSGTYVPFSVYGLNPDTEYILQCQARRTSNQVYGLSAELRIKTLGSAQLISVNDLQVDDDSSKISIHWAVHTAGYTYKLEILDGAETLVTINGIESTPGTSDREFYLSAEQRNTLIYHTTTQPSFAATYSLTTWSGSAQIGVASTATANIKTSAELSGPYWDDTGQLVIYDSNSDTVAITGNNQVMIKGYSTLAIESQTAFTRNGATLVRYEAMIAGKTASATETELSIGTVGEAGELTLTVTAIDSRGFTAVATKQITVADYNNVILKNCSVRRMNEVDALTEITFTANLSEILIGETNKNSFTAAQYRCKKTNEDTYGEYADFEPGTISDTRVSSDEDEFASFDPDYSWDVEVRISDKLSSDTIYIVIPQGIPLLALRPKKIGINNPNPQAALDINGNLLVNGVDITTVTDYSDDIDTPYGYDNHLIVNKIGKIGIINSYIESTSTQFALSGGQIAKLPEEMLPKDFIYIMAVAYDWGNNLYPARATINTEGDIWAYASPDASILVLNAVYITN